VIGRDKRQSPYTERNAPSKPSQPHAPSKAKPLLYDFMLNAANMPVPKSIVYQNLKETIANERQAAIEAKDESASEDLQKTQTTSSIRMPALDTSAAAVVNDETTILTYFVLTQSS
jgi:hypothetical protein